MIFSAAFVIASICGISSLAQARSISKRSAVDYTFSCSFETNDGQQSLCGMEQDVNDIFDWTIHRDATESEPTGPSAAYDGEYYAYIEASYPRIEGDYAILKLPDVFVPGQRYCMEFQYHMYGFHVNQLQLLFMSDTPTMPIWSLFGEQSNEWIQQQVEFNMASSFRVAFLATRGPGYTGDIAIDDIHSWLGSCSDPLPTLPPTDSSSTTISTNKSPSSSTTSSTTSTTQSTTTSTSTTPPTTSTTQSTTTSTSTPSPTTSSTTITPSTVSSTTKIASTSTPQTPSTTTTTSTTSKSMTTSLATGVTDQKPLPFFTCSFELTNGQPTFCNLEQSRSDDFDWSMRMGTTPSEPTGPREAASAPYYAFIETSSPRQPFDKALMMLPAYTQDFTVCVEFNYNMYGHHINRLDLGALDTRSRSIRSLWYLKGEQGPNWFHASVTVDLRNFERLAFCGARGGEYSGDIALDDIEVYVGACGSTVPRSTPSGTDTPRTTDPATTPKIQTTEKVTPRQTTPSRSTTVVRQTTPPQSTPNPTATPPTTGTPGHQTTPTQSSTVVRQTTPPQSTSNPTGTPPDTGTPGHQTTPSQSSTVVRQTTPPVSTTSTQNPTGTPPQTGTPGQQTTPAGPNTTPKTETPPVTGTSGVTATTATSTTLSTTSTSQTTPVSNGSTTPHEEVVVNWGCDFETSTGDIDWCGIQQDQNDIFDWTLTNQATPSDPTGPDSAWNGQNYIFIESSNPRIRGDDAMIRLPAMGAVGLHCIEFQYHMYGHHINKLKVGALHSPFMQFEDFVPLEIYSGDHGRQWIHGQVMVDLLDRMDQISLVGVRGDGYTGDIALDAISVKTGICQNDIPNQP